jgi:hypothetical protein
MARRRRGRRRGRGRGRGITERGMRAQLIHYSR